MGWPLLLNLISLTHQGGVNHTQYKWAINATAKISHEQMLMELVYPLPDITWTSKLQSPQQKGWMLNILESKSSLHALSNKFKSLTLHLHLRNAARGRNIPLFGVFSPLQEMPCIAHTGKCSVGCWFQKESSHPSGEQTSERQPSGAREKHSKEAK